ncbi:MAG: hypothetical protein O3A63_08685 [Proteobacteria bacterium]|nr:hypothetical protein [Pseudomonadota bacterium]
MQNQHGDYQLGNLDEDSYRSTLESAASEYSRWQMLGVEILDHRFEEAIRAHMAK